MITCAIDMFGFDQMIYYTDQSGEKYKIKTNMDNLGIDIANACQVYNCYTIKIYGSKAYADKKVIPQIYKYLENNYDLNKVDIEVIL